MHRKNISLDSFSTTFVSSATFKYDIIRPNLVILTSFRIPNALRNDVSPGKIKNPIVSKGTVANRSNQNRPFKYVVEIFPPSRTSSPEYGSTYVVLNTTNISSAKQTSIILLITKNQTFVNDDGSKAISTGITNQFQTANVMTNMSQYTLHEALYLYKHLVCFSCSCCSVLKPVVSVSSTSSCSGILF